MEKALMVGMMALLGTVNGWGSGGPEPTALNVVVLNEHSGVSREVLEEAIAIARRSFNQAGLGTAWSVCRYTDTRLDHCEWPTAYVILHLRLEPETTTPGHEAGSKGREFLGYAHTDRPGRPWPVAYIFYGPVRRIAAHGKNAAVALGCVLSHELAHLLGLEHSPSGIMHAQLNERDLGMVAVGLGFRPDQVRVLRAGLPVLQAALLVHGSID